MNPLLNIFTIGWQQAWELVGWTMCYFLVLGTVVAIVGAAIRFACRLLSPQIRYTVSLSVFISLALLPVGIASWLFRDLTIEMMPTASHITSEAVPPKPAVIELKDRPLAQVASSQNMPIPQLQLDQPGFPASTAIVPQQEGDIWENAVWFLPWVWIVGAPLTFVLLTTGLIGSQRLRKQSTLIVGGPLFETCERLRRSLRVTRNVSIAICERVASPLLVGIVRPLVLLPPAALSGWTTEELEMVLLHELAHVRRWDNLANFLQRVVESVLFFHPGVWWVSRWVRVDREECCDAVVVSRTAKPLAYAELLVALATPTSGTTGLASLAMAQHPLAGRIRRILKLEDEKMLVSRSAFGWLGLVATAVVIAALWQPSAEIVAEESAVVEDVKEITTKSAEDEEIEISFQTLCQIPTPSEFASPRQHEIWQETHLALLKSQWVLGQARDTIINEFPNHQPPSVSWFQNHLEAKFLGEAIAIEIEGKLSEVKSTERLQQYVDTIIKIFTDEVKQQVAEKAKAAKFSAITYPAPFLSPEDQRSADLAYRMLQLELEPLNEEELKRAKAMNFRGGLRITAASSSTLEGTLLVGLHSWPVVSLKNMEDILQEAQKQELSTLKYYIIRQEQHSEPAAGGGFGGDFGGGFGNFGEHVKLVDKLVTGRIEVKLPEKKRAGNPSSYTGNNHYGPTQGIIQAWPRASKNDPSRRAKPTPYNLIAGDQVKIVATDVFPDQPIDDVYTIEDQGTVALGPTYGRVRIAGVSVLAAEEKILEKLKELLTKPAVQVTLFEKNETQTGNSLTPYVSQSALPTLNKKTPKDLAIAEVELRYAKAALDVAMASYKESVESNKKSKGTIPRAEVDKLRLNMKRAEMQVERAQIERDAIKEQLSGDNGTQSNSSSSPQASTATAFQYAATPASQKSQRTTSNKSPAQLLAIAKLELKYAQVNYEVAHKSYKAAVEHSKDSQIAKAKLNTLRLEDEEALLKFERAKIEVDALEEQVAEWKGNLNPYQQQSKPIADKRQQLELELQAAKVTLQVIKKQQKETINDFNQGKASNLETVQVRSEVRRADLQVRRLEALLKDLNKKQSVTLLYDNKTFEQWRSLWKNELKTEKRTEAIKAMTAFARAGYGKEAAEAILDVAGEYDFSVWGEDSAEGSLKKQLLGLLNSNKTMRLEPRLWLSGLLKRYEADPKKWKSLVLAAIPQISFQTLDDATRDQLIELSFGGDLVLQNVAASGLSGAAHDDTTITPVIEKLLASKDPNSMIEGVYLNVWYPRRPAYDSFGQHEPYQAKVRSMPNLLASLRHKNENVRKTARERLRLINTEDAKQVTMEMMKDLGKAQDDTSRIISIRTLAALGTRALNASGLVEKYHDKKYSQSIRLAAAYAYTSIATDDRKVRETHLKAFKAEGLPITDESFSEEEKRVNSGGGGFGGGGGGGFF